MSMWKPLTIGGLTLQNRIAMAPLTRCRAGEKRVPNSLLVEHYVQRASAGLLISEAVAISERAVGFAGTPGVWTDEMVEGWKMVTDAVHSVGGSIFLQLWHMGRASHSSFQPGNALPIAPSALRIENDQIHTAAGKVPYEVPRALETSEIPGVIDEYRTAARNARKAGFDGVEIHGANGYLVDQFLQSTTNHRTDRYGGSVEARSRFMVEVVQAVTEEWPKQRVGIRLSPNGVYNGMGSPDFRQQFDHALGELNKFDLAYVHLMDGLGFGFHKLGDPFTLQDARKLYKGILIGNCGYTQETAEAAISAGHADMIAFGRPFISNPDLVNRFQKGWPLAPMADMATWYAPTKEGYNDFPAYKP